MLSQFYITTFLFVPMIVALITVVKQSQNVFNTINPNFDDRITKSRYVLPEFTKIIVKIILLFLIYIAFIGFISFFTKQLVLIPIAFFLILIEALITLSVVLKVFLKLSDFELQVSEIKNFSGSVFYLTEIQSENKKNINRTILGIISHFVLVGIVIYISPENIYANFIAYTVTFLPIYLTGLTLEKSIMTVYDNSLRKQKGFLSDKKLKNLKNEIKNKKD